MLSHCLLSLTNNETALATPLEQMWNLWWASARWKLVATHFYWCISPPICFETCLQPKRITEVHHKVSKNALKVKGWLTNCLKFGKPVIWICFEVKSDFFSLETSIWTSHWDCLKFGKTFTWICLEVKSYFFRIRNQHLDLSYTLSQKLWKLYFSRTSFYIST